MSRNKNIKKSGNRIPVIVGAILIAAVAIGGVAMMAGGNNGGGKSITIPTKPVEVASVQQSLDAFRGKVVILDFWATWCGPCRSEIPGLVALQNKYRDQGVEIIGVSLDPMTPARGGADAVEPFMKRFGINYSIWTVNNIGAITGYDVSRGIPTKYVLNREGQIVKTYIGAQPAAIVESDIKQLL